MAQQWHFEQDEQQRWHWRRTEDAVGSRQSFSSAIECMLDAVRATVQRRRTESEVNGKDLLQ